MKEERNGEWTIKSKTTVYENDWIAVEHNEVTTPSGSPGIYGVVRPKNYAIAVLAMDEDQNVWIVGQHRFPTGTYQWELPKGGCRIGEEGMMEAGRRELKEETGITASTWQRVLVSELSNCFTDEVSFSYLATDLSFGEPKPDPNELLEVRKVPFEQVVEWARHGAINCVLSQATVFAVKLMLDEEKRPKTIDTSSVD